MLQMTLTMAMEHVLTMFSLILVFFFMKAEKISIVRRAMIRPLSPNQIVDIPKREEVTYFILNFCIDVLKYI